MRGILFKPDMIQASVEGRKTNTRRAEAGLKEINKEPDSYYNPFPSYDGTWGFHYKDYMNKIVYVKPHYQVGETVYIKEAWYYDMFPQEITDGIRDKKAVYYRLDGEASEQFECWSDFEGWQSPLFMPEWAARYFPVITDVRAERLQEITFDDCLAEGIVDSPFWVNPNYEADKLKRDYAKDCPGETPSEDGIDEGWNEYAHQVFRNLWNSINKEKWESNPWVFAYTFRIKR